MTATENSNDNIIVVIAAYNEAGVIDRVVREVRSRGYTVVVVDDGSSDGTASAAATAGARVVRHPVNLGQGAALETGLEFGRRCGYQRFVTFDADGQHNPDDISRLLSVMTERQVEVVLGSRFRGKTIDMSPARRALLKAATLFTRLSTGMDLTDTHNGLRALSRTAAETVKLRQNRMAHASEFLDQVSEAQLPYAECPVTIRYTDYSKTKGQGGANAINIIIDLMLQRIRK